jgi:L-alanine-DL-glutamate epimerase-like enolase superfamily enzyme
MRISEMHVYRHELPVVGGTYKMASTSVSSLDTTLVEIVTETGLKGYGESCPVGPVYQPMHALGVRSAFEQMGPHLIGVDALRTGCVHDAMEAALNGYRYAKAAVDIALWDIAGKAYDARVCELLGGPRQETVPSYYALGVMTPDAAVEAVRERQAQGFRRLQIKVGGRELQEDIETIRRVCEVLQPGVRLAVDANRGWTTRDALHVSLACRDQLFVMEQPCGTYEEIAALRGRVAHPIYLDESTEGLEVVLRALGDRICDGFGLKVTRLGGLSTMRTVRDLCRAAHLPMTCDDSWGGDIIAAACTHIGATVHPQLLEGVWIAAPYIDGHYDSQNGIRIEGGGIRLPTGPGLGVEPETSAWGAPVMSFG